MTGAADHDQAVREEALGWFVRLQDQDCRLEDWRAFHAWLEAEPGRADAYAAIERLWVETDAAAPGVSPLPLARSRPPRRLNRTWIAAGAALAAGALLAVFVAQRPSAPPPTVFATALGQTRAITLADGSRLVLNSGTRLSVALAKAQRSVELEQGEASFDVAHDKARPFVIAAGDRRITVVGTEFDVLRTELQLTVTVRQGVVAVDPAPDAAGSPLKLAAGQQLRHTSGQAASSVAAVDPQGAFAWREGRLVYQDRPLGEVAADLGRYYARPIHVDAAVARLGFTGVLRLDDQEALVRRLEMFLPIRARISATEIRLSPGDAP